MSGAVSGVTTPGASRLHASQLQERSATTQRLDEACSGADCVFAGADVVGGEVVEGEAQAFPTASKRSQGVFGKTPLTSREAMMRLALVSWRKMASCADRPGMAP